MSLAPNARRLILAIASLIWCAACGTAPVEGSNEAQLQPPPAKSATNDAEPVTFFDDRPLDLPSPDGRYRLVTAPSPDGLTQLIAIRTSDGRRQLVGAYEPPTAVLWSPSSDGFFVNDQRGSGQSSYLEVVRMVEDRFRRDVTARGNLVRLYNRLFECALAEESINTAGDSWPDASTIIVEVQASHHSGGCPLDPYATNQLVLLVNARTGEVQHRRAVDR